MSALSFASVISFFAFLLNKGKYTQLFAGILVCFTSVSFIWIIYLLDWCFHDGIMVRGNKESHESLETRRVQHGLELNSQLPRG